MKAKIFNVEGKESKEIDLPKVFSGNIREDVCQKVYEAEKKYSPYAPYFMAGKQHSASGIIKHARHKWKGGYGKGISRVPRKILWRRGTQFYWVGAEVAQSRGGRRAHPPRVLHFQKIKKINEKERSLAMNSGFAGTASKPWFSKRYEKEAKHLPLIVESGILKLKAKEFYNFLGKVLNDLKEAAIKKIRDRKGRIKSRAGNRKSAGLLLVIGKEEKFKIQGIDVKKINEIEMRDLWPLGRLTIYTEQAIKELEKS